MEDSNFCSPCEEDGRTHGSLEELNQGLFQMHHMPEEDVSVAGVSWENMVRAKHVLLPSFYDVKCACYCKVLWKHCISNPIKNVLNALIHFELLSWDQLFEDGNLLWEMSFTERPGVCSK